MFASSNRLLINRKLLKAITYKINNASYLHICGTPNKLSGRRVLSLNIDQVEKLKSICSSRLISTNANEILNKVVANDASEVTASPDNTAALFSGSVSAEIRRGPTTSQTESLDTVQPDSAAEFPIPEPPVPPPPIPSYSKEELLDVTNVIIDPPFEHLGLGGWGPVGLIQNGFEFLHTSTHLPWWGCIAIATVIARTIVFPIVIISQRNNAKMANNLPRFQELQLKVSEAKQRGDFIEAARFSQDLLIFMKEKKFNPIKTSLIPLVQAPVFISFFVGLRGMANVPVKSMHNEGLFWFTDLTVPDQFYILPILTSLTMLATIEVGTDSSKIPTQNAVVVKQILRFLPLAIFPFSINFPGAILIYWVTTNSFSLLTTAVLRVATVRTFFKIPPRRIYAPEELPIKKKGFVQGVKDFWNDTKQQNVHSERERQRRLSFNSAGRGAVPKTYKYNPTIPRVVPSNSVSSSAAAKKFS